MLQSIVESVDKLKTGQLNHSRRRHTLAATVYIIQSSMQVMRSNL